MANYQLGVKGGSNGSDMAEGNERMIFGGLNDID